MLQFLSIKNYALIKNLDIEFNSGFITITGETGAGKSILLGALSLILGERADINALLDKNSKCIIEGKFNIKDLNIKDFFDNYDLDYANETILRREINTNGKSRAFINDTPVNLTILKEIGLQLVDIHSQNNNLILNNQNYQLQVIDTLTNHSKLLNTYQKLFLQYKTLLKNISELELKTIESKKESDYLQFQFNQISEANLKENEQIESEKELEILNHAEEIKSALSFAFNLLFESDTNIQSSLIEISKNLQKISRFYPKAEDFHNRLESVIIELKDLSSEIELSNGDVVFDQEKLNYLKERLDLIYSLEQKHQVSNIKELITLKDDLNKKIQAIGFYDDQLSKYQKESKELKIQLEDLANKLSSNRKLSIPQIEKNILSLLSKLGMPNASIIIRIDNSNELNHTGKDIIKFLFSSNIKVKGREIAKVASGGELSRVMLAIKALISNYKSLPTIIFDEIDSGVSGDIAYKMGEIMSSMSKNMQVISITHLAQIASKGNTHYLVYKENSTDIPTTKIKQLVEQERITEIAKMLSGESLTHAAMENAKELLKLN
ncbi:MAG: DNA repair protein RecN [Chlorobi bacterium]|nr:DNA repair protein RecN [Chlorobiota bacterium]